MRACTMLIRRRVLGLIAEARRREEARLRMKQQEVSRVEERERQVRRDCSSRVHGDTFEK